MIKNLVRKHHIASFIIIAYVVSWIFWLPMLLFHDVHILFTLCYIMGGFGPLISGYIFHEHPKEETKIKHYMKTMFHFRSKPFNYGFVILCPIFILLLSIGVLRILFPYQLLIEINYFIYPFIFLYMLVLGGGLEEPGWRGFMLQSLLKKHGPIASSLFIGIIWVFWHTPLFFSSVLSISQMPFYLFLLNGISLSLIMTFSYLLTFRNVWLMMLLHAGYNAILNFYPTSILSAQGFIPIFVATTFVAVIALVILYVTHKKVEEKEDAR